MARPKATKLFLVEKYKEIVAILFKEGYDGTDIAFIMNRDRSVINRLINKK